MNARIDGPGIAGRMCQKWEGNPSVWHVTTDAHGKDCPCAPCSFRHNLEFWQTWHKSAIDANHPAKPDSSTTPETGEATDGELLAIWKAPRTSIACLREVYNLGRTYGEAEVCKRLPRLWGFWDGGKWYTHLASNISYLVPVCPPGVEVREFDPMTGGPKA